ncbi:CotS family spore coat protein [Clostridium sp. FP1]|uniref:CotS family spore coat protein n=1 Tax=Clostridium sp. FP1 TaxID=2724076 RepID=UPI0013E9818D|nr:CotS family spore coat protein [Clostridium sp. FP1]MBZ9634507.1 CotS family spore coat protein [Clostridium sp. FP1]
MGEENINLILAQYDITVTNIRNECNKGKKAVWWIKTPHGDKILKKHSCSAKTLQFILAAVEHLLNNNVKLPRIIKTKQGAKFIKGIDCCYVLSEAISGVTPNEDNPQELRLVVQQLANFHSASKNFVPPNDCKVRIHLGLQGEEFQSQMTKLKGFYDMEQSKSNHSEFGQIILNVFPYFYKRMELAITENKNSGYNKWVEADKNLNSLCHQDFTAGNLILTKSKEIFVLDIDSIAIDLPTRDIRKFLNKVMKRHGTWDLKQAKQILHWYNTVNPLEFWKWQVLREAITFPHLFVGIMSKYYEEREATWTEDRYVERLKAMIKVEKSIDPILQNFEKIIPS